MFAVDLSISVINKEVRESIEYRDIEKILPQNRKTQARVTYKADPVRDTKSSQ